MAAVPNTWPFWDSAIHIPLSVEENILCAKKSQWLYFINAEIIFCVNIPGIHYFRCQYRKDSGLRWLSGFCNLVILYDRTEAKATNKKSDSKYLVTSLTPWVLEVLSLRLLSELRAPSSLSLLQASGFSSSYRFLNRLPHLIWGPICFLGADDALVSG